MAVHGDSVFRRFSVVASVSFREWLLACRQKDVFRHMDGT
jgi:hypothetical protein